MRAADHALSLVRRAPRWLFPALGVAVVATAATILVIVRAAGAACPAGHSADLSAGHSADAVPGAVFRPVGLPAHAGTATYYATNGGGNCSFDPVGPGLYVALGPSEYAAGAACGEYLNVTGPKGTVRVKVTDQCPECAPGHLDLSKEAFARIGDVVRGTILVSYQQVTNPKLPAALTVQVKDGASRYWLAVRIDNHGNPLSGVEVRGGSSWTALTHTDYNYWIKESGAGPGPYTLRLTDTAGHTTTVTGVVLAPQRVQQTSVWMYQVTSPTVTSPAPASAPAVPSGSPSADTGSPSGSETSPAVPAGAGASPTTRRRC